MELIHCCINSTPSAWVKLRPLKIIVIFFESANLPFRGLPGNVYLPPVPRIRAEKTVEPGRTRRTPGYLAVLPEKNIAHPFKPERQGPNVSPPFQHRGADRLVVAQDYLDDLIRV